MWYWRYEVKTLNRDIMREEKATGIVYGKTFSKAVKKLEEYYDDELIAILFLEAVAETVLQESETF